MPSPPLSPLYDTPSLDMELLVFQRGFVPGRATLRTLRSFSAAEEAKLDGRVKSLEDSRTSTNKSISDLQTAQSQEAATRANADTTEAQTRSSADAALGQRIDAEAFTRAQADTTEANARQSADTALGQRITDEATARQNADTQEAQTRAAADAQEKSDRQAADSAEATARANADAAEVTARTNADAALQTQITALKNTIVPFPGAVVTLPAGLSILAGKSTRTITVTGLKKNDNLVVTPNAALPANISMGEAYCATDGVLTVVLINSATLGLSITTAQTIPLGVIALRP